MVHIVLPIVWKILGTHHAAALAHSALAHQWAVHAAETGAATWSVMEGADAVLTLSAVEISDRPLPRPPAAPPEALDAELAERIQDLGRTFAACIQASANILVSYATFRLLRAQTKKTQSELKEKGLKLEIRIEDPNRIGEELLSRVATLIEVRQRDARASDKRLADQVKQTRSHPKSTRARKLSRSKPE